MASLPADFLSTAVPDVKVTRVDFANTPLKEYAELQAYIINNVLTSSECATLLSAAEASGPWQRAMIQVGNGQQRQEDDQRKCGRLIWDSPNVAQRIWDRVKGYVPEIAVLDRHSGLVAGGAVVMRGQEWEVSRLNERLRFLKYEGGEYFRGLFCPAQLTSLCILTFEQYTRMALTELRTEVKCLSSRSTCT
jgi:hypothetical protein